jgi:hypothetical protein
MRYFFPIWAKFSNERKGVSSPVSAFFTPQHQTLHGATVFKVISTKPIILASKCRVFGDGAIPTYIDTIMARAGLELKTFRSKSQHFITETREDPLVCHKRRLNGAGLRTRPKKTEVLCHSKDPSLLKDPERRA